jgi:formylglycine-generating enzyme required for sulfatase activity
MAAIDGRFCVDRWEASTAHLDGTPHSPYHLIRTARVAAMSREGVVPQAHVSGEDAERACKLAGKRLCTSQQWHDACKGSRSPYRVFPYGATEHKGACNTQRPVHPTVLVFKEQRYDVLSLNDPRLNQNEETVARTGEFADCVTPDGVFDLHGNLLEWVMGPGRHLLLGGHYLDGKKHGLGCGYVTAGHWEKYADYTTGFRCCAPVDKSALDSRPVPEFRPPERATPPDSGAPPDAGENPAAPAPPSDAPRDPRGMRGFTDPAGVLPVLSPPPYPAPNAPCPVDMALVDALRCSVPLQVCLRWLPRLSVGKKIACAEFEEPSRCVGTRRPMSYCIDRFELQPPGYSYPITHVNWAEAQNLCHAMDKRLCFEDEWELACEGPEGLPFPYGYVRDGKLCNHDFPEEQLVTSPDHFVDRRVARDALPGCKSPFGVFNLVGNVDEWTARRDREPGKRAILRGGWWLIGRNRCRAATDNHGEHYAGVQTGLRCCKGARGS